MVSGTQATQAALRVAYRIFGPRVRQLIVRYGEAALVAAVSYTYPKLLAGSGQTSNSPINLITPVRSPAFSRLESSLKRKRPVFEEPERPVRRRLTYGVTGDFDDSSSSASSAMYRRSVGRGVVGPRFRRPAKKKYAPKGAYLKYEYGNSFSGQGDQVVFIGHTTHQSQQTLKMVVMGLIEYYCRSVGQHVQYWTEKVGESFGALTNTLAFTYTYRDVTATGLTLAPIAVTVPTGGSITWEAFAILICNSLVANLAKDEVELYQVGFDSAQTGTVGSLILPARQWKASEVFVTVEGKSILQLQNRTPASDTPVSEANNVNDIGANPVRGKSYKVIGSTVDLVDPVINDASRAARMYPSVLATPTTGFPGGTSIITGRTSKFSGELVATSLQQYLYKPPRPSFWKNCSGSNYVHLGPGEIRKSIVEHSVKKSFNQWMKAYAHAFQDAAAATLAGIRSYSRVPFSRTILFGFEKMCDANGTASLNFGFENIVYMRSYGSKGMRVAAQPLAQNKLS